jgi:hypothetical protein
LKNIIRYLIADAIIVGCIWGIRYVSSGHEYFDKIVGREKKG